LEIGLRRGLQLGCGVGISERGHISNALWNVWGAGTGGGCDSNVHPSLVETVLVLDYKHNRKGGALCVALQDLVT
jgi:hypothetical protein